MLITKGSDAEVCHEKTDLIQLLAGVANIAFVNEKPHGAIGTVGSGFEAFVLIGGNIDVAALKARFTKEIASETAFITKVDAKLSGKFAENAPAEVVAAEKEKRLVAARRVEKLTSYIQSL